jgi:MFS family permease
MFNGARIVGPAVAGILVANIGEGWCFFANGVSYIAVIAGLLMMRLDPFRLKPASASAWHTIREGFTYVGRTAPIRSLLVTLAVISFAGLPYAVLMPIFADRILHEGAQGFGILMGVSGAGALLGALLLASRTGVKGLGRWVAVATMIFAVSLAGFAWSGRLWLSCSLLFVTGFAAMITMGSSNTLIQSMIPDHLRGRVMSVYSMSFIGMGPFGSVWAGYMAEHFGAPFTLTAGAVACLAVAVVFAARLPAFRAVARELIVAQQATGGTPVQEITATGAEATMESTGD